MAGYNGYSKSNNAISAEENGLLPASILARKLKVKTAAIRALLGPEEWHHTSKHYNRTNYYSVDDATEILEDLRTWKPAPSTTIKIYVCDTCGGQRIRSGECWTGYPSRPCGTLQYSHDA